MKLRNSDYNVSFACVMRIYIRYSALTGISFVCFPYFLLESREYKTGHGLHIPKPSEGLRGDMEPKPVYKCRATTSFQKPHKHIVTIMSVTIDGVWIDARIYWTLWYSAWLHFKIHHYTYTYIDIHSQVVISCCSVTASNGGRFPSSGSPNYPRPQLPASHSNSSQQLNLSSSLTHSLTD
jgi:hypothetical protein